MHSILIIDLSDNSAYVEALPEAHMDAFMGGRGLGAYLLYKYLDKGVHPLSPDNVLVFTAGPLQGTKSYYSAKSVLTTKSPLTGIYLYSIASGSFAHRIRKAGYVALIVRGAAAKPMYVVVEDNKVEFKDASEYWGMLTAPSHDALIGSSRMKNASCVCIGPAGERLNPMSCVATEGQKARTFGRGGAGAIMGSKMLKGLVVGGTREVDVQDTDRFAKVKESIRETVKEAPTWVEKQRRFGTGSDISAMSEIGILPSHNWRSGRFSDVSSIDLTQIEEEWPRKNVACGPYCISPCSHIAQIDRGQWKGSKTEGPEYETIYAFGSNCGINRFDAIVAAEEICDQYGIDTISCGASIAFGMECYERGLIDREMTGGIDLSFGNAEGMVETVALVAKMEGIGALLSQGTRSASKAIEGSESFAMQSKGLELGGYECRGMWGQALEFAINSRGGDHHGYGLLARMPAEREYGVQVEGKGELVKEAALQRILVDSAVVCAFPRKIMGIDRLLEMINSVTGKSFSKVDSQRIGLRIATVERMLNVREGARREDDSLPERLLIEPLPEGPRSGSTVPIEELLDEGYRAFGWDEDTGVPLKRTLESLGLDVLLEYEGRQG